MTINLLCKKQGVLVGKEKLHQDNDEYTWLMNG